MLPVLAMTVRPHTHLAVFGMPVMPPRELQQRVQPRISHHEHRPTAPSIPAARPPLGHKLLAMKRQTPIPALSAADVDGDFVNKQPGCANGPIHVTMNTSRCDRGQTPTGAPFRTSGPNKQTGASQ